VVVLDITRRILWAPVRHSGSPAIPSDQFHLIAHVALIVAICTVIAATWAIIRTRSMFVRAGSVVVILLALYESLPWLFDLIFIYLVGDAP
jgi:hypothetical protein